LGGDGHSGGSSVTRGGGRRTTKTKRRGKEKITRKGETGGPFSMKSAFKGRVELFEERGGGATYKSPNRSSEGVAQPVHGGGRIKSPGERGGGTGNERKSDRSISGNEIRERRRKGEAFRVNGRRQNVRSAPSGGIQSNKGK